MVTIITKSIDASGGGDYTSFTLAEADLANIGTSSDLVANDEAIVFEAEAGTYAENLNCSYPLVCDATRNVTFQSAAGGQAVLSSATPGAVVQVTNAAFLTLRDLKISSAGTSATSRGVEVFPSSGRTCQGCLFDSLTIQNPTNVNFAAIELQLESSAAAGGAGSAAHPTVIQNCVDLGAGNGLSIVGGKTDEIHMKAVNCTLAGTGLAAFSIQTSNDVTVEVVNTINLSKSQTFRTLFTTGAVTTSGSNNFGNTSHPFPAALQAESQTWTFTTDTTAASTGSQVIYDATTGAMINVSGNDAVGVGTAIGAPTTDILGKDRIRDTHADPGAFTTDLRTITKSIDLNAGGNYTSFTLAEADVENIGRSVDLVKENTAIVFEAEAGTYTESVMFDSTLTTDETRNVTYRPASGSEHGAVFGAGVVLHDSGSGYGASQQIRDNFTVLDGLEVHVSNTSGFRTGLTLSLTHDLLGVKVRNSLLWSQTNRSPLSGPITGNFNTGSASAPIVFENLLIKKTDNFADMISAGDRPGYEGHYIVANCTFISDNAATHRAFSVGVNGALNLQVTNVMSSAQAQWYQAGSGTLNLTGSNNLGGSAQPFPAALQAESQTWTFTTDTIATSTGNQVIYESDTGAMINVSGNDAVGVGTAIGAPTTDILGKDRIRDTHADPGAFTTDLLTITKTIDAGGGGDYTSFSLAEASVVGLSTNQNLVERNEAIVFEAVAGTYPETFSAQSPLVTDATRNITYKAQVGSEHGGVAGAGVFLNPASGNTVILKDNFTTVDGICVAGPSVYCVWIEAEGAVVRNVIASPTNTGFLAYSGTVTDPIVIENCVSMGGTGNAFFVLGGGAHQNNHARIVNCTGSSTASYVFRTRATSVGTSADGEFHNCVSLYISSQQTDGAYATVTGSSTNVGGAANAWPSALQAESQTWTFTTDTIATSTGNQVIYEAGTGRLSDAAGNDAWQILTDLTYAPVTDIEGVTRSASGFNPGAFETTFISSISGQGAEVLGAPSASGTGNTSIAAQGVLVGPSPTLLSFANLIITAQANLSLGAADLTALGSRVTGGTGQLVTGSPSITIFEGDLVRATGSLLASATQLSGRNTPTPEHRSFLTTALGRVSVSSTGIMKAAPGSIRGSVPGPKIFAQGNIADIPKHSKGSGFLNRQ